MIFNFLNKGSLKPILPKEDGQMLKNIFTSLQVSKIILFKC